jgi:hypothetical protein
VTAAAPPLPGGTRSAMVLGAADGAILVLGLVAGMIIARQGRGGIWHAALSDGLAELVGMAGPMWLANGRRAAPALACGIASAAGAIIPALPFLAWAGTAAVAVSLALTAAEAGVIAWLRPERGALAVAQTYGLLVLGALVCAAGGLT